jgi:hypothetical protein
VVPERDLVDALDARGLVRFALAVNEPGVPQTFALEAYYAGPRGAGLATALAALAALLLLGACAREAWRQNQLSDSARLGR